ncbi:MAG: hypothetical protein OK454_07030 [Thaumarchaeota archaeon]|nr:hypothetical protein [Nitrososphaerota archaeon]
MPESKRHYRRRRRRGGGRSFWVLHIDGVLLGAVYHYPLSSHRHTREREREMRGVDRLEGLPRGTALDRDTEKRPASSPSISGDDTFPSVALKTACRTREEKARREGKENDQSGKLVV